LFVRQSLTTRVPIDKLALARLAAPVAAKISEGEGEQAFLLLRDALPTLGASIPVADRVTVLLNAQDRIGDTCLHSAVKYKRWQCAGRLIEMGACPWLLNSEGRSPIDLIKDLNDPLPKKLLIPKARAQLDKFAPPPVQAKILKSPLYRDFTQ
jgi:ankyrin repeat protein